MGLFEARTEIGDKGNETSPAATRVGERLNIAFGVERLGFLGLRAPILTLAALATIAAFAEETRKYPSNEYDVLVVVEGGDLLGRPQIGALRRLVTDLQPVDGDSGLVSLFCARQPSADRMTRRPGLSSLGALVVLAGLSTAYFGLTPRYRLADQAPDREHAIEAINRIDAKLAGANPVDVMIAFPSGQGLYSPETLEMLAQTHAIVEAQAGLGDVWSLQTLRDRLKHQLGRSDVATMGQFVNILPRFLVRRFVAADGRSALIAGRIPDKDASALLPVVDTLDAVRAAHPGYGIDVTGVFPVVAAGGQLRTLGLGLQFASVIALTISFGLGLSATVHFLNRLWRESGPDPAVSVRRATVLVGPALIPTSLVLVFGLAATAFSTLPLLKMSGWLSAFAMFAALVADLTILRPMMTVFLAFEAKLGLSRPALRQDLSVADPFNPGSPS